MAGPDYQRLLAVLRAPAPRAYASWDARHPQWHQLPFDVAAASSRTARVQPDILEMPPGLRASWPFPTTHRVQRVLQPLDRRLKVLCAVVAARMAQEWLAPVVTETGPEPASVASALELAEEFVDGDPPSRSRRDSAISRLLAGSDHYPLTRGGGYSSDHWAFTFGEGRPSPFATAAAGSAAGAVDCTVRGACVAIALVLDWLPRRLGGLDPREPPFAEVALPMGRRLVSEWWRRCRARLALRDVWTARLV